MTPVDFPQATITFGPPDELPGSCNNIRAFVGQVNGGVFDGSQVVVTAWKPSAEELERLNNGGLVYLSVMGALPPHFIGTKFKDIVIG